MNKLKMKANRIIREVQQDFESHVEVCIGTDSSVELDIRDLRFVSVQQVHDSFISVRLQKKEREYFVSLPGDTSISTICKALDVAYSTTMYTPFATSQEKIPQKKTNPLDIERLLNSYVNQLTQENAADRPYVNDLKIHDRTIYLKNTRGIDVQTNESYVVIGYDIMDNGLNQDGKLCYPIKYCPPGEIPSNRTAARHSGRFRSKRSIHDSLVLLQANVVLELLAVWAQEQDSHRAPSNGCFSDVINISERTPFCRFPRIDDTGRSIKPNWFVRNGRICSNHFHPQGGYRKEFLTPPKAMWNTLILHPSKRPLRELLSSINKGFYIIQIVGLVLGQDFQQENALNLRFEGFDVLDGKIVGESRWIDRAFSLPALFRSVIAVDDQLYHGRWKWADGWYASPSVVFKDLFVNDKRT